MAELGAFLLPAVPLLALLACLLLRQYPGCDAIVRLAERLTAGPGLRAALAARLPLPQPPRSFAPGGGLLLAFGLARRPPPIAA